MKTYEMLTLAEQEAARNKCLTELLETICQDSCIEFLPDETQAQVRLAFERAERMRTPWFAAEYVMEECGDVLREIATLDAQAAVYADPGDPHVIHGVAQGD